MRHRIVRRRAAVLLAAWLATGCHSYAAVPVEALPAEAPVRVRLTDRGSVDLADALGPRAAALHGRLQERGDSAVVLRVAAVRRANGTEEPWNGERVRLPLAAVAGIERERVSGVRSGLLAGGIVAVLAVAVAAFGGDGGGTVPGGPIGGQPGGPR